MKKLLALLLCLAMVASVLAGCGGTTSTDDTQGNANVGTGKEVPDDYVFRIGLPVNSLVEDYEFNAFTLWLEEETGYEIEIVTYNSSARDYQAQIATEFQVPGQKMPDILAGMDLGQQAINDYGVEGYLIDLAPYFNDTKYSQQWWDHLNQIEDKDYIDYVTRKLYADDGKAIYAFPEIEYCTYDMMRHQAFINQEWLDKLNLPMPTNKEELYDTLVAFRDKDPNGNNEKDEIPLIGRNGEYGDVVSWIMGMFCYMEDARTWRVDDQGKISGFYWDDDYREGLIFLNKLVKEKLMPDTVFTLTGGDLSNLINPLDGVETVGIWLGHPTLVLTPNSDAVKIYKAMPQWGYAVMDLGVNRYNNMVTRDCEYPDAAWEILMAMSSEEGSYRQRYGEKGVDWDDADPNTTSFTGAVAEIKVLNQQIFGGANAQTWNDIMAAIGLANENERTQFDPNSTAWNDLKLKMMGETYKANWDRYEEQGGRPKNVVMPLVYTTEEDDEVSVWRNNTNNWYKTNRANFIKGVGDLNNPADDAQWQAYIDGFKTNNYYDWLEVAQDVYDFTYGSKSGK